MKNFFSRKKTSGNEDFLNIPMTPLLLARKYEEEQYLKYGIKKRKRCTSK